MLLSIPANVTEPGQRKANPGVQRHACRSVLVLSELLRRENKVDHREKKSSAKASLTPFYGVADPRHACRPGTSGATSGAASSQRLRLCYTHSCGPARRMPASRSHSGTGSRPTSGSGSLASLATTSGRTTSSSCWAHPTQCPHTASTMYATSRGRLVVFLKLSFTFCCNMARVQGVI